MSDKLLPIVPGCRAIVMKAEFKAYSHIVGTEVICVERWRAGNDPDSWVIDSRTIRIVQAQRGTNVTRCGERFLMRIDGGKFDKEKDDVKLYALPKL